MKGGHKVTDIKMLDEKIKTSGISKTTIASKAGITREALYNKLNGKTQFNVNEMKIIADILHLNMEEKELIFFTIQSE